jgi:predicted ATPase
MHGVPSLPSGIVTFVFTDIEQSTRLLRRLGPEYPEALDHHFALLRRAWSGRDGHEVDAVGDSDFVVFEDAAQAVEACADAQRLLAQEEWPVNNAVRVRIGVHSGLASPRGNTYVALAVHQAVRVMSAAHGGQVLVSRDTVDRVPPLPDVDLVPKGRFRVRDFEDPVSLFEVSGEGLPRGFPAIRAVPADGHNLVAPPSPFVGRESELKEVALVAKPGHLVTLTGTGGVGKTRLATEVGLHIASEWPDGVWLVDLGSIQEDAQIAAAIGDAIGAPGHGGDRWRDVLQNLRDRRALIVLDGCEPFAAAAARLVDELLGECPGCGVMATSRVPLGLGYEVTRRVGTLPLPGPGAVSAADLSTSAAVELFVDRARSARHDIVVDESTAPIIRAICERLDGLPLALELAAARLGVLTLKQVYDGLADRFQLLRSHNPTMHERQRTMEALLEWSNRLLGNAEQACLRRLAVFGASFSIQAAVAPVASGNEVTAYAVPELVWSLVDSSLVVADLTANDTRYRLLESVRAFARERLEEHEETQATAERLASWYLARIGLESSRGPGWVSETGVELANLRALVPLVDAEQGQVLAVTIGRFLDATGSFLEGIDELTRYGAELPQLTPTRISLLTCLADLYLRTGDVVAAERVLDEADVVGREVGAPASWDDVGLERSRGDLACRRGENDAAIEAARRTLSRDLSARGRARMYNQLGIAALAAGDVDTAREAFAGELQAYERLGDQAFQASSHGNLAEAALRRGDSVDAARHQSASLELALELGNPAVVAFSMIVAARLTAQREDWATAATLHAHAEGLLRQTGLALYDDDRQLSDTMLEAAHAHLGDDAYAVALAAGRALDLPDAADLAQRVLAAAVRDS